MLAYVREDIGLLYQIAIKVAMAASSEEEENNERASRQRTDPKSHQHPNIPSKSASQASCSRTTTRSIAFIEK